MMAWSIACPRTGLSPCSWRAWVWRPGWPSTKAQSVCRDPVTCLKSASSGRFTCLRRLNRRSPPIIWPSDRTDICTSPDRPLQRFGLSRLAGRSCGGVLPRWTAQGRHSTRGTGCRRWAAGARHPAYAGRKARIFLSGPGIVGLAFSPQIAGSRDQQFAVPRGRRHRRIAHNVIADARAEIIMSGRSC